MAGGISFQTQRALNELDKSLSPTVADTTVQPPAKMYARPPGIQTMTPEQEAQYRRLQEVRALRAKPESPSGYKYQD